MERPRHVCVIDWFGVNYDGPCRPFSSHATGIGFVYSRSRRQIPRPWNLPMGRTGQMVSIDKISQRMIVRKDTYD